MDASHLFTAALRLQSPWKVGSVGFRDADGGRRELRIMIVFEPGARFHCPETGCREDACPVHDRRERVWRHLDFFRYKAFIHAAMPRVTCPEHGVRTVPAPWARPGSGFTLLFEAWAVEMARHLPAGTLAEQCSRRGPWRWPAACPPARSPGNWTRPTPVCGGPSPIASTRRGGWRTTWVWRPSASTGPAAGAAIASPWSPISWSTMSST